MAGQGFVRRRVLGYSGVWRGISVLALLGSLFVGWVVFGVIRTWRASHTAQTSWTASTVPVAEGVIYHYYPEGDALVQGMNSDALALDVDLKAPGIRVRAVAENPTLQRGRVFAEAHNVHDWCLRRNALAGVNGGFFGATQGEIKQAEGLLVTDGKVHNAGRWVRSSAHPDQPFLRSALGFTKEGRPRIGWVVSNADNTLLAYNRPQAPTAHRGWSVDSAVACGPRLIAEGKCWITDHEERLVSPFTVPRTFVAYDLEGAGSTARPRHLLLGIAMEMTYQDVADFLQRYFRQNHHSECAEAMCLDGGSSSQLVFRDPASPTSAPDPYINTRPSGVTVPTAVLIESSSR